MTSVTVARTTPGTTAPIESEESDWACAFAVVARSDDARSTEDWARSVWERAPAPMRWVYVAGWRLVLRLRLGPRNSPDHVLGWRIVHRLPDETVVDAASSFLSAHNGFRRERDSIIWSTFVRYKRPIAKIIWPPVSVFHRVLVRRALRRAASDMTQA